MKKVAGIDLAKIDLAELTLRLMETGIGLERPAGPAPELLQRALKSAENDPDTLEAFSDFQRMAATAMEYFAEEINKAQAVN